MEMCKLPENDPITLDDILNLWDGLKETPGRILGISSNHYNKLDPALVRPGRIDITINFDNSSRYMNSLLSLSLFKLVFHSL
jgi:chaperone BCS1